MTKMSFVPLAFALAMASGMPGQVLFPKPSGPYPVGTTTFHWVDETRDEALTPEPGDKRELMVQLWYPIAKDARGEAARYFPDFLELAPALSDEFRANERKLKAIRIPALRDAPPLAKKRLPVIVFSHGMGTSRLFYTSQMLELASHGYCVASLDHTYDVEGIVFPGPYLVRRLDAEGSEAEKAASLVAAVTGTKKASARLQVWATDLSFVVDKLESLNAKGSKSPFAKRLDLKRLGVLGHCYGAEAAMLAASRDKRFKACANQNGWPPATEAADAGLTQPLLFLWGELSSAVVALQKAGVDAKVLADLQKKFRVVQTEILERLKTLVYRVEVKAHKHMDFTDLPVLAAYVDRENEAKSLQQQPRMPLVASYTVAFFDTYLEKRRHALLHKPAAKHQGVDFAVLDPKKKPRKKRGKKRSGPPGR